MCNLQKYVKTHAASDPHGLGKYVLGIIHKLLLCVKTVTVYTAKDQWRIEFKCHLPVGGGLGGLS